MFVYSLTLTQEERNAIDFVGYRYATGDDLFRLLMECEWTPEEDWDCYIPLTFEVPEHIAWQICDLAEEEDNLWPLFSEEFASKMQTFVDSIV